MSITKRQIISAALTSVLLTLPQISIAAGANKEILGSYLAIQEKLAADTIEGVSSVSKELAAQAAKGKGSAALAKIEKGARAVGSAKSVKAARQEFKALSDAMIEWNRQAKNPGTDEVYCSMAPGSWLQKSGPVANPYYGKQMLRCGEKR